LEEEGRSNLLAIQPTLAKIGKGATITGWEFSVPVGRKTKLVVKLKFKYNSIA
jgi:hypothetical protein